MLAGCWEHAVAQAEFFFATDHHAVSLPPVILHTVSGVFVIDAERALVDGYIFQRGVHDDGVLHLAVRVAIRLRAAFDKRAALDHGASSDFAGRLEGTPFEIAVLGEYGVWGERLPLEDFLKCHLLLHQNGLLRTVSHCVRSCYNRT